MTDYSWLEPIERRTREIREETQRMKDEIEKMKQETHNLPVPDDAPWLNLSQKEINQLRKQKQQLTEYGKQKLRKLMEQIEWEQIYNEISKSDDHIVEKVNTFNLTNFIRNLMIENENLREKVEELQNDVEILKGYAWEQ